MLALVLAAQLVLTPRAPISTDVLRSAPGTQTRPAIASNGEELFAVWEHRGDVIGSRIRPNGTAIDTNLGISLQPTWVYDMRPSVVWNGESWVVAFFSGPQPWPLGAKLIEVNRGGEVITELPIMPGRDMTDIDLAWNGSRYLVTWCENAGPVRAQFFDRAFGKIGGELTIADEGFAVAAASNGASFFVAWNHATGTFGRGIAGDGTPGPAARLDEPALDVDVASNGIGFAVFANEVLAVDPGGAVTARKNLQTRYPIVQPALAANGANWIAAWYDDGVLMSAELDAAMRFVREPARLVNAGTVQTRPAIAVIDGRALVVYSSAPGGKDWLADILSVFIGEPSTTHLISSGLMHQDVADAAWSGSTLGVLWYESEEDPGSGLRLGVLSSDGVPLTGGGIPLADGAGARLASNGTGFAVAAVRNTGVEVDLLPSMATVPIDDRDARLPLIASNGRDYYVVWTRNNELRGRRIGADGSLGEIHTFPKKLSGGTSVAHDIVWTGDKYVVLTWEGYGFKYLVTYTVTATEVSADGVPAEPVVLESAQMVYAGYQGRLGWNGETLLYARSAYGPGGWSARARVGLSGADFVVLSDAYVELNDVAWDGREWLYLVNGRLLRGDDSIPVEGVLRPVLAQGPRTAIVTTVRVDRIPNHLDQSVRRGFVSFAKAVARHRAVRE